MATVIDCVEGPDGVWHESSSAERLAEDVKRGLGAVEQFVETGRNLRNALDLVRGRIRAIGKPVRNPRRKRLNPFDVVDAEEV